MSTEDIDYTFKYSRVIHYISSIDDLIQGVEIHPIMLFACLHKNWKCPG